MGYIFFKGNLFIVHQEKDLYKPYWFVVKVRGDNQNYSILRYTVRDYTLITEATPIKNRQFLEKDEILSYVISLLARIYNVGEVRFRGFKKNLIRLDEDCFCFYTNRRHLQDILKENNLDVLILINANVKNSLKELNK